MKNISFFLCLFLTSCTLSFNNIATEGHSSDIVDEQQTATPKIDPVLNIPATNL